MNEVTQKDIDKAFKDFSVFDKCPVKVCPTPVRLFEIGEDVRIGNLKDCVIKEILYCGKAYRVDYTWTEKNRSRQGKTSTRMTRYEWWHGINKIDDFDNTADRLFNSEWPGSVTTRTIDSFTMSMGHGGLVCDPTYQRGYVWDDQNQHDLMDSIFNRINIGSIVIVRHAGYNYDDSDETVTYINFDGDEITIPRKDDYTSSIVDGQQRLTTIWRYYTNQFKYNGKYYCELNPRDMFEIENTTVSLRIVEHEQYSEKDILNMFLKLNRGVPQDEAHLDSIKQKLESLK